MQEWDGLLQQPQKRFILQSGDVTGKWGGQKRVEIVDREGSAHLPTRKAQRGQESMVCPWKCQTALVVSVGPSHPVDTEVPACASEHFRCMDTQVVISTRRSHLLQALPSTRGSLGASPTRCTCDLSPQPGPAQGGNVVHRSSSWWGFALMPMSVVFTLLSGHVLGLRYQQIQDLQGARKGAHRW